VNDRVEAGASQQPSAEPSPWNVPNALTVLRILMVPLFLVLLLADGGNDVTLRWWALIVFLLAMFTDFVDGYLARRNDLITNFGKIADPIADKSLMAAALIGLAIIVELPWWVPVIILVREFGITVLRFFMIRIAVMPASRGGKVKTVLQTAAIGLFLLVFPLSAVLPSVVYVILLILAWVIMTAAIVSTIVTGVDYCVQAAKLYKDAKNGGNAQSDGDAQRG
jgi:CDP-diacylglycerol--glycerol-3-phosphate 3-phosphatidyltransferase